MALLLAFLVVYRGILTKLLHDWATDDNYSHGFLILPIAAFLVWERRHLVRENGVWKRSTVWTLPANTLVHVTIYNFDGKSGLRCVRCSGAYGATRSTRAISLTSRAAASGVSG